MEGFLHVQAKVKVVEKDQSLSDLGLRHAFQVCFLRMAQTTGEGIVMVEPGRGSVACRTRPLSRLQGKGSEEELSETMKTTVQFGSWGTTKSWCKWREVLADFDTKSR